MILEVNFNECSASSSGPEPIEVDEGECHINDLPLEILSMILESPSLSDRDRASAACVCRQWATVVYDRHPYGLGVTVFCEKVWKEHFGYQIEEEIPKRPPIEEVLSTREQLKGNQGSSRCILALMPNGLTFNTLRPLMEKPQKGHATPISYIRDPTVQALGDKAIDQTCWVLFTESVIEGSRNRSYAKQKALIAEKTDSQCALPELIVAVACVALKHVKTGERILSDSPRTYARCKEMLDGRSPLVVGGFSSGGLGVYGNTYVHDGRGAVACRKF